MDNPPPLPKKGFGCLHVLLGIIIILLAAILGCMLWWKLNIHAAEFKPVVLNAAERTVLDAKVKQLEAPVSTAPAGTSELAPEAYKETEESRRVVFSEKEMNALVAGDPDVARHVAIDLSDDLLSVKIVAPMDKDLPVLGGKTLKFNMGLALSYTNDKPTVIIRGISIGGIPLPGAWWGDIKNKNLVSEFGEPGGFWDMFSKGVKELEVKDDQFILHLKE